MTLQANANFASTDRGWAASSSGSNEAARERLKGCRVLVVEDEMLPALDITMSIEDLGGVPLGPIDTLKSGLDFMADGRGEEVDVAILDVNLHGEDVFPLADALHEREVPFLFHTGHGKREVLQRRFPDAPVVVKPVLVDALLDAAGELLD